MVIDFSSWEETDEFSEGSGASEKIWLVNGNTNQIGLFKYPKDTTTTEHVSEKIASVIAKTINIPCANVDIGTYNQRLGSMSYLINNSHQGILEGIHLLGLSYDRKQLYDKEKDEYYSLDVILNSLRQYNLEQKFINVVIFDYLIGNTDRHQNNWALLITDFEHYDLCPIYDNGSSLCSYVPEHKIKNYLGKDYQLFNSLVDSKSKSRIRIDKHNKKQPTHFQVISYLKDNFPNEVTDIIDSICNNITEININNILNENCDNLISNDRKQLILKFLLAKVEKIKNLFERSD